RARREQVLEAVARQNAESARRTPTASAGDSYVAPPAAASSVAAAGSMNPTAPLGPGELELPADDERDEPDPGPGTGPLVPRYGKLAEDMPAWFKELDLDRDGQVSLYEWRISGRPLAEFQRMDRNNDGFLTVEEVRYYEKHVRSAARR